MGMKSHIVYRKENRSQEPEARIQNKLVLCIAYNRRNEQYVTSNL